MPKLVLTHTIDCDVARFWTSFFDRDLCARLFVEGLGFKKYETLAQEESAERITRTIKAEPRLNVPGPVAKLMGSSFAYTEAGVYEKAAGVWRWKLTPSTLASKINVDGKLTVTASGDSRVVRHIEIDIEAKVMVVGGMIEDTFKKQLSEGWDKGALVQNEWLRIPGPV